MISRETQQLLERGFTVDDDCYTGEGYNLITTKHHISVIFPTEKSKQVRYRVRMIEFKPDDFPYSDIDGFFDRFDDCLLLVDIYRKGT